MRVATVARHQHDDTPRSLRVARAPLLRAVPAAEPDYTEYLKPVRTAVRRVAQRCRLSPADAEDLHSEVWLKLLAGEGRLVKEFRCRSRIETYLTTVALNLVRDRRDREWGKWRPSQAARRRGAVAVLAERLIARDGLTADAAEQWLRCTGADLASVSFHRAVLRRSAWPRRRFVGLEEVEALASPASSPFETLCRPKPAEGAQLKAALVSAVQALASGDRELLLQRYAERRSVADIAAMRGVDARPLYAHLAKLLRRLRECLVASGFDRAAVARTLAHGVVEWDHDLHALGEGRPRRIDWRSRDSSATGRGLRAQRAERGAAHFQSPTATNAAQ